jgi:hypothetical protein
MSLDRLDPLPSDLGSLLDAERAAAPPAPAAAARVLARVEHTLGLGTFGLDSAPGGKGHLEVVRAAPGASSGALAGKIVALVALAAAGVGALVYTTREPAPTPITAAPAPATAPAPAPALPAPVALAPAAPPVRPVAPRPARPDRDTGLGVERQLLEAGGGALVRGDVSAAFASVSDHHRRFARGRLAEEREVLWIQLLLRAGDRPAAEARAARFRARWPSSIQLPVVEAALGKR